MNKKNTAKDFAYFNSLSQDQYNAARANEGNANIDDETIVFVASDGKIYTHGSLFGGSSSEGKTYTGSTYINVDNNANTISLSTNNLLNWINQLNIGDHNTVDIQLATDSKIGGFKTGYQEPGDKTYRVQLDSQGRAFVQVPWSSALVNPDDPNALYYEELQERLNTLLQLITGLRQDIDSIHLLSEEEIKNMLENIFNEVDWLKEHFPQDEIFNISDYFNDINGYLQLVGLINSDGTVGWSSIIQTLNDISARVSAIQQSIGNNGEINLEVLLANLQAYIDGKIAGLDLTTRYAVKDENQLVIEWMTSGFKSQAGKTEGDDGYKINFALMYADAFDGVNNATSIMRTEILYDVDGKISAAKAEIGTQMQNNLAGVITESNIDSSVASLFALNSESGAKAAVMATVENDQSFIDLVADHVTIDADTTVIQGYLEGGDATFKGTVKADNLYRNVCFCTMSDGGDNNALAQIVYYNENYQYIEPDGDGREYLNDGEIYSSTQITNLRNQHQSNPDDVSWWNQYRNNCFIPCIGKSDIIELSTFFTTDHDASNEACVMLPDPTYCQGKLIELYSNNYNATDKDRNRKFRVAAIGKNGMGNMVSGMFRQLNDGFETSTLSNYVVCETGCQYRFVAATVNNTPAWIKLEAYPKYHEMFMFDYDHYIYIDRNQGNKLMYHRGGGAADVTIAN